jgi:fibronectin type 3 domain-containing protein
VGVKYYYKIIARNGDVKSDIKTAMSVFAVRPMENVKITKTIGHETGNILYWDAVDGAKLYQVYRLNNGKWELLKNTGSLAYKDETAPVGAKSYYKIVARNGSAMSSIASTGSASAIRPAGAVTKLDNVSITATNGHSTGNILYWNAVEGAKLYQVYRLEDGKWVLLKNTGSLAYKDEAAPVGVASYYKIVARNGDVKSDIKTTASARVVRSA